MKKQSINREIDQNTDFGFTYYLLDNDGNKLSSNEIALENVTAYCSVKKYPSSSTSTNLQTSIGSDNQSHIFVRVYATASQTITFKEGTWFYDVIVDIGNPYIRSKVLEGLIFVYPSVSNTNSFISAVQNDFAAVLKTGNRLDISTYTRLIRSPFNSGYSSPETRATKDVEYDDESQRKMQRCCDAQNYWMNFIKSWSPEKWVNDGTNGLSMIEKFLEALRIKFAIDRYLKWLLLYEKSKHANPPIRIPLPNWLVNDWPLRLPQFPPVGPIYWPDELIPFKPLPYWRNLGDYEQEAEDMRPMSWHWPWQDAFNPNQPSILDIFPGGFPKRVLDELLLFNVTCRNSQNKFWDLMLNLDCECLTGDGEEHNNSAPCKNEYQRLIDTLTDPSFNANSFDPEETDCCTSFGFMAPIFSFLNCLITKANQVPCLFGCDEPGGIQPIGYGGYWWSNSNGGYYYCTHLLGAFLNSLRRELLVGWLYCQFECAKRGYGDAGGPCDCLPDCILPINPNDPQGLRDIEDIIDPYSSSDTLQPESWQEIYRHCPGLLTNPFGGPPVGDGADPYPPQGLPDFREDWSPFDPLYQEPAEEFTLLCGSYFNSADAITFETKMCCDCVRDLIPTCIDPVPPDGGSWPEGSEPEPCTPSWNDPISALCGSVLNLLNADTSGFIIDPDTAIPGGTPINLDLLNESCGSVPNIPPKPPRDVGEPESEGITPFALRQKCKDLSATYLMEVLSWIQCILDYLERNHPNEHDDKKRKLEDLIRKIEKCMVSCVNS